MQSKPKNTFNIDNLLWSTLALTAVFSVTNGFLACYSPNDFIHNSQNSCIIVLAQNSCYPTGSKILSILEHLGDITFKVERGVEIGVIDIAHFQWPNQQILKTGDGDVNINDILLFPKHIQDRTCLLTQKSPSKSPKPLMYSGTRNVAGLVNFVNIHCNTYRTEDGAHNIAGLHRNDVLNNLFTVSLVSNVRSRDVFKEPATSDSCAIASKAKSRDCNSTTSLFKPMTNTDQHDYQIKMKTCDRVSVVSKEDFFHNFLKRSKPVIFEKSIKHWDAFKKWSNEYLVKLYGNNSVHVKLTPGGEFEGVEKASLWEDYSSFQIPQEVRDQLQYPDLVVVRPATANVKFSEFLDLVKKVATGVEKNVSAYLEYSSIPEHLPDLERDIQELPFMKGLLERKHLNIWLSDGNTLGKLHFDPFDNLLCQISGRKEVILFEPHDNRRLYESHIPEAKLSYNHTIREFRRKDLLESTSMVMSPVDIARPDFERFPLFADTYPLNCTIGEGDVLFMPAFWWHEVQSYPNTDAGRNLAVNFWYEPFLTKEFPCPECRLEINPKYRHLL